MLRSIRKWIGELSVDVERIRPDPMSLFPVVEQLRWKGTGAAAILVSSKQLDLAMVETKC